MKLRNHNFLLAVLLSISTVFFGQIPPRPTPPKAYNEFGEEHLLSAEESEQIEQELRTFEVNTSNAIVVVVVEDLHDMEIEQYADELGEAWGVGTAQHDNGIVFLIKPFGEGERKVTIQVGRGLEGIIPDLVCKDIIDREFIPNMKAGNPRNAIEQSLKILKELAQKEYSFKQYHSQDGGSIAGGIFAVIIIMLVIYALIKKGKGGPKGGKRGNYWGGFWGGGFGGGYGGGYGGGGSSGGFGGFGGGSFGGGGASGSW